VSVLTFMGASSSSRMGCEMKISRALVHRKRISVSKSCTCLPGLLPRTSKSRSMMESKSTSCSAIAGCATGVGMGCGGAYDKGVPRAERIGWKKS